MNHLQSGSNARVPISSAGHRVGDSPYDGKSFQDLHSALEVRRSEFFQ